MTYSKIHENILTIIGFRKSRYISELTKLSLIIDSKTLQRYKGKYGMLLGQKIMNQRRRKKPTLKILIFWLHLTY